MIFIGIGSNLSSNFGDRFTNIDLAVRSLESYGIKVIKRSSYYESLSFPNKNNPKFINIVICVETDLPPVDLMSVLIFIEEKLERKRNRKNDPRTCDLDIIDFKSQVSSFKYRNLNLSIPHIDLANRNFVLFPLKEISPNWKHPKTNVIIDDLILKLPEEEKKTILIIL